MQMQTQVKYLEPFYFEWISTTRIQLTASYLNKLSHAVYTWIYWTDSLRASKHSLETYGMGLRSGWRAHISILVGSDSNELSL